LFFVIALLVAEAVDLILRVLSFSAALFSASALSLKI
jgi:hypothetical protein